MNDRTALASGALSELKDVRDPPEKPLHIPITANFAAASGRHHDCRSLSKISYSEGRETIRSVTPWELRSLSEMHDCLDAAMTISERRSTFVCRRIGRSIPSQISWQQSLCTPPSISSLLCVPTSVSYTHLRAHETGRN